MDSNVVEQAESWADAEVVREKILHVLSIYPVISPTMLQVGIGVHVKPKTWRPIFQKLLEEGAIREEPVSMDSPSGRFNTYSRIYLSDVSRIELPEHVLAGL